MNPRDVMEHAVEIPDEVFHAYGEATAASVREDPRILSASYDRTTRAVNMTLRPEAWEFLAVVEVP